MAEIQRIVRNLYSLVNDEWRKSGNEPSRFPEASFNALLKCDDLERISVDSLLDYMLDDQIRNQLHQIHPAAAIPLLKSPRFNIYIHLWSNEVADLHSHQWGGAFTIINGESIHAKYSFEQQAVIHTGLRLGSLDFQEFEKLTSGDVRMVSPGLEYVHGVAHIPSPSVSLSIRNSNGLSDLKTFYRHHSNVAISSAAEDSLLKIQARTLCAAYTKKPILFTDYASSLFRKMDTYTGFRLILSLQKYGLPQPLLAAIIADWCTQTPERNELVNAIPLALRESIFGDLFMDIQSHDVRRFLAILMFSPDRLSFNQGIKTVWPADNQSLVLEHIINQFDFGLPDTNLELCYPVVEYIVSASTEEILNLPASLLLKYKNFNPSDVCSLLSKMRANPFFAPLFIVS